MEYSTRSLLRVAEPNFTQLEEDYLLEAWRSTFVSGSAGSHIQQFEETFSSIAGCQYGVACCNGTVALHLALKALHLQAGDEVLVPDFTYVAAAAATVAAGGVPVLVDCDATGRIDPKAIRAAVISGKSKFLMVVHLYGHPCDMVEIMKIAKEFNLIVVEDCAEAHGALCDGQPVGSFGSASTFSFFANKIMTTGEGGMVCTNDKVLATRIKFLCTHAMDPTRRYFHTEVGFNYRMSNLLAAVGCAQLARFDDLVSGRRELITFFREHLDGLCGLQINPKFADNVTLCPWLACVLLPDELMDKRDHICQVLLEKFKIDTRPFFHPMHSMPPYEQFETATENGRGHIPQGALRMHQLGFNIPTASNMANEDAQYIVDSIKTIMMNLHV
jgi:perosamine synthetase